ncbi:hypothetical protein ACA910_008156 [Epithemia clementina (nom. ined.)]
MQLKITKGRMRPYRLTQRYCYRAVVADAADKEDDDTEVQSNPSPTNLEQWRRDFRDRFQKRQKSNYPQHVNDGGGRHEEEAEDAEWGGANPATTSAEVVTTAVVVELTEQDIQRNRRFMTIVHFVLTYPRWSFSLFLLLASSSLGYHPAGRGERGAVLPTPQEGVQAPIQNLWALVALESRAYYDCTVHAFDEEPYSSAQQRLRDMAEQEWQVSMRKHQYNLQQQLEQNVTPMVRSCKQQARQAQRALTQWHNQQQQEANTNNSNTKSAVIAVPWRHHDDNDNQNNNSNHSAAMCTTQDREILIGTSDNGNNNATGYDTSYYDQRDEAEEEVVSLTGQINEELSAWRRRTVQTATQLATYAQNRSTYDYNYFVGYKFTTALNLLTEWDVKVGHAMIELPSLPEQDLLKQLRKILQGGILDFLDEARVRLLVMEARLESFYVSIDAFRLNYQDLYHRLQLSLAFVKDFVPPTVDLPSYMDLSNIPLVQVLMPSPVFSLPQFHPAKLPEVNIDVLLASIVQLINALVRTALLQQVSDTFRTLLEQLLEALQAVLQLEDYDPPQYNGSSSADGSSSNQNDMNNDLDAMEQNNQGSQERIFQLVQDALFSSEAAAHWEDQLQQQGNGALDSTTSTIDNMAETTGSSGFPLVLESGNATSFAYLEPTFPSFAIPEAFEFLFSLMFAHQWMVEIIIQFIRIFRLKQKYEKNATPDLPEIDLVTETDENGEEEEKQSYYNESSWSLIRLALLEHLLLTPWMMVGLILLPVALFGVFCWFPHVKHSCIDTRNGTFIARSMIAPVLINMASVSGNAHYTMSEFNCRRLQRNLCTVHFHESGQLYRSDLSKLQSLVKEYNESIAVRDRFQRCFNLSALDLSFSTACCGLEGYTSDVNACSGRGIPELCPIDNSTVPQSAFQPISQILDFQDDGDDMSSSACWPSEWWEDLLVDSRFDCTNLFEDNLCGNPACTGVDSFRLVEATIEADCQVELYVVKCCVLVLLALYHGIMVNLISSLAFNGVKRVRWRKLKPDGIKFRTHVAEEDGKLVKGGDPKERLDRIQMALRRFQQVGQVQLVLSAVLFAAWFLSFLVLRRQLLQRLFFEEP